MTAGLTSFRCAFFFFFFYFLTLIRSISIFVIVCHKGAFFAPPPRLALPAAGGGLGAGGADWCVGDALGREAHALGRGARRNVSTQLACIESILPWV